MSEMPDYVRLFILPITVGTVTAIVSAIVTYIYGNSDRVRKNREEQVSQAKTACANILEVLDELYSYFQHDAWHAAWRRRKIRYFGKDTRNDPDLMDSDKRTWQNYEDCLARWRKQDVIFETQLEAYFEVEDFDELRTIVDTAAIELWKIQYGKDDEFPYSEYAKKESRQKFDVVLSQMRLFIKVLSLHLIKCIQDQNVGNLRFDDNFLCFCRRGNTTKLFNCSDRRQRTLTQKMSESV